MANAEQFQQMLTLLQEQQKQQTEMQKQMQTQMKTMNDLQEENARLREAPPTENGGNNATNATNTTNERRYNAKKPERPVINAGIDDREWVLFLDTWARYKTMLDIRDTDVVAIRMELRTACSVEVNKLLFEYVGPETLNSCNEADLLQHIKSVAVKVTDKEVHRVAFGKMNMNDGEAITHYVARLKAKAFLCKFEVPCDQCNPVHNVSYSDERVAERLIAGLRNQDHQRKILSEAATLKTLDEKVKRLQILETTEESASMLHTPNNISAAAAASTFQKSKFGNGSKKDPPKDPKKEPEQKNCRWCGYLTHGKGKSMSRSDCPATNQKCNNCKKKGHFTTVCERERSESTEAQEVTGENLEEIASDASVSFGFAASAIDSAPESNHSAQDFRRVRRPTKNT